MLRDQETDNMPAAHVWLVSRKILFREALINPPRTMRSAHAEISTNSGTRRIIIPNERTWLRSIKREARN